ncbi:hypothetical protein BU16DRAFT_326990 [Lophium mytilinum]|uniref:Uncharacterized protein n=1 Tax=Lophium mytilinum TaxID=390894 RepID=A0A6A6R1Y2_9PEZI|nr:hypothetical protein BU16DRAFT_326990 [Lophium mytilinum]
MPIPHSSSKKMPSSAAVGGLYRASSPQKADQAREQLSLPNIPRPSKEAAAHIAKLERTQPSYALRNNIPKGNRYSSIDRSPQTHSDPQAHADPQAYSEDETSIVRRILAKASRLDRFSCAKPTEDSDGTDAPARPVKLPAEKNKSVHKKKIWRSGRTDIHDPHWETGAAVNEPVTSLSPSRKTVESRQGSQVDSVRARARPGLSITIPSGRFSPGPDDEISAAAPTHTLMERPDTPLSYLPTVQEELDSFSVPARVEEEQKDAFPVLKKALLMLHPNSAIYGSRGGVKKMKAKASKSHAPDRNTDATETRPSHRRGAIDCGRPQEQQQYIKEEHPDCSPDSALPQPSTHTPPRPTLPELSPKPAPIPEAWWTRFPPAAVPHPNALTASNPLSIHNTPDHNEEDSMREWRQRIHPPTDLSDVRPTHSTTHLTPAHHPTNEPSPISIRPALERGDEVSEADWHRHVSEPHDLANVSPALSATVLAEIPLPRSPLLGETVGEVDEDGKWARDLLRSLGIGGTVVLKKVKSNAALKRVRSNATLKRVGSKRMLSY